MAELTPPATYRRDADSLEFDRLATFCDAIFAIAMTLLTLGIGVPVLAAPDDAAELADQLQDRWPEIFSFALSFLVIGFYWVAHHRFVALLAAVDRTAVTLALPYLLLIAFLPYPTSLIGRYEANATAFVVYAVNVAAISAMEWVMLRHAHRRGHLRRPLSREGYRWATIASLMPSVFFLASVPVAFVSTQAAVLVWLANVPVQAVGDRLRPAAVRAELR